MTASAQEDAAMYTIKNLRDVRDAAPDAGVDATQEMRFAQGDLNAERTGVSFMAVKPGRRQAIAHRHDEAEEVYVILSGSGRIKLDDDIVDVGPLDAIRIAPTVTRALEGGPAGHRVPRLRPAPRRRRRDRADRGILAVALAGRGRSTCRSCAVSDVHDREPARVLGLGQADRVVEQAAL